MELLRQRFRGMKPLMPPDEPRAQNHPLLAGH
jgi:hypothetical protein